MSNRVVLVSLVSALCLAGTIARADTAPPAPAAPKAAAPVQTPIEKPWDVRAKEVLDAGANRINLCWHLNGPWGPGTIVLRIAQSGAVEQTRFPTDSKYEGTAVGSCVAHALENASLPSFSGSHTTVDLTYAFVVELPPWATRAEAVLDAVSLGACKHPGGQTGPGKVDVAVLPNGNVASVVITDKTFAGTETGSCIAGKFRLAHFDGYPARASETSVTVHHDFVLN